MRYLTWILVALLLVLHQDYWQWDDARLVLGFVPYCLAYHTLLSLATAAVWFVATRTCWPEDASEPAGNREDGGSQA